MPDPWVSRVQQVCDSNDGTKFVSYVAVYQHFVIVSGSDIGIGMIVLVS